MNSLLRNQWFQVFAVLGITSLAAMIYNVSSGFRYLSNGRAVSSTQAVLQAVHPVLAVAPPTNSQPATTVLSTSSPPGAGVLTPLSVRTSAQVTGVVTNPLPSLSPAEARSQLELAVSEVEKDPQIGRDEVAFGRWRSRVNAYLERAADREAADAFSAATRTPNSGLPLQHRIGIGAGHVRGMLLSKLAPTPPDTNAILGQINAFIDEAELERSRLEGDSLSFERWKTTASVYLENTLGSQAADTFRSATSVNYRGGPPLAERLGGGVGVLESFLPTPRSGLKPAAVAPRATQGTGLSVGPGNWVTALQSAATQNDRCARLWKIIQNAETHREWETDEVGLERWLAQAESSVEAILDRRAAILFSNATSKHYQESGLRGRFGRGLGCLEGLVLLGGKLEVPPSKEIDAHLKSLVSEGQSNPSLSADILELERWLSRVMTYVEGAFGRQSAISFSNATYERTYSNDTHKARLARGLGFLDTLLTQSPATNP